MVLVPFYRGAVVFEEKGEMKMAEQMEFSSPFIEERLYFKVNYYKSILSQFSSPFIEERLYLLSVPAPQAVTSVLDAGGFHCAVDRQRERVRRIGPSVGAYYVPGAAGHAKLIQ